MQAGMKCSKTNLFWMERRCEVGDVEDGGFPLMDRGEEADRSMTCPLCQHAGPAYKRPKRINGVALHRNAHKPPKEDVEWSLCLKEEVPL